MERIALFGAGTVAGSLVGAVVMALWLSATRETERSEESIRSTTAIANCHKVAEDAVAAELACKVRNGEMRMLGGPSIQQIKQPPRCKVTAFGNTFCEPPPETLY